jgi:hypothetical protein
VNDQPNYAYGQHPGPYSSPTPPPPPKKKHTLRTVLLIVFLGPVAVLLGVATLGGVLAAFETAPGNDPAPVISTSEPTYDPGIQTPPTAPAAKPTKQPHSVPPKPKPTKTTEAPTAGQAQALGAAEDYLATMAFSRKGLIKQLSSEYGSGFSKADATYAADHVTVDWNEQAAKAAKEYLAVMHFSRSGLIKQLTSDYGSGFTRAQAVYGVNKAGL